MKFLSEAEFKATMISPMTRVAVEGNPPCDFWGYFDVISQTDFAGHDCSACDVTYIWNNAEGSFQHVLVNSEQPNVFMVVVIDLQTSSVFGHRLLDLNREYGLKGD